ncbi:hypothetical protein ME3_00412 [Bartonella melophagi K-2C]|uniref:Uncharacterized protein n=1 Tax=Bartonella melophagi K-2C TaxID=1094557 RepID=J0QYZ6_9HYPH|nr:hypothetical protein ME3_00412 [Bartonella melophagi K-2C]
MILFLSFFENIYAFADKADKNYTVLERVLTMVQM